MADFEDLPFGPVPGFPATIDNFTYEDVRESHCVAQVSNNVCRNLIETSYLEGKRYLAVCCPAYNEESEEMLKTLSSLLESFYFMKHKAAELSEYNTPGIQDEFQNIIPLIVPLFDGTKALSDSMREWISANFPNALDDLDGKSEPGKVDVRNYCSKWYYAPGEGNRTSKGTIKTKISQEAQDHQRLTTIVNDLMKSESKDIEAGGIELQLQRATMNKTMGDKRASIHNNNTEEDDDVLYFYLCPVIKKSNHRKHNSHQWFFDSICDGLEDKIVYGFLTDTGTAYDIRCLPNMVKELALMPDLIGVTARQRIDTPNEFFHPCESSPWCFLKGDHSQDKRACWKCWATYVTSPCMLQGFELEASTVLNLALFNLVEALPVMPGPCQLVHWQKMKKYHVVDEYFNLLFEGENEGKLPPLPDGLKQMQLKIANVNTPVSKSHRVRSVVKQDTNATAITFTEFLRVNMRLAEDRILSFVSVFSTGYGTKWIPGSVFYYQPEVQWNTLLTQRRRWTNGTFAGFLFYFMSDRARSRVRGGLFDKHKPGRSVAAIDGFFALQVFQMSFVFITPSVFCCAARLGFIETSNLFNRIVPDVLPSALYHIYGPVTIADVWTGSFLAVLAMWIYLSFNAPRGKMPEWLCQLLCFYSFLFLLPVLISVWYYIGIGKGGIVGVIVITTVVLPFILSFAESPKSSLLYLAYLPWFVFMGLFFLVFMPHYSFARLWDTTWGNRAGGKDSAINDGVETYMKRINAYFSIGIVVVNCALTFAFAKLFALGYITVVVFMFFMFLPFFIQMFGSLAYMFIILPIRRMCFMKDQNAANSTDLGIDADNDVRDIESTTFFMESAFPVSNDEPKPQRVPSGTRESITDKVALTHTKSWLDFSPPGSPTSNEFSSLLNQADQDQNNDEASSRRMEVAGRFCKV